jgi:hypothetical protein
VSGSLGAGKRWTPEAALDLARRSVGAVLIGLPRWQLRDEPTQEELAFPSEFGHYEGALFRAVGLPTLVLVEEGLVERAAFDPASNFITWFPRGAGRDWLEGPDFQVGFAQWKDRLNARRDVFLGYCTTSSTVAGNFRHRLEGLGASVLDWQRDSLPGGSLLGQIEEAAARCSAGIFLFTRDDRLAGRSGHAAPRDNVVFEAGYFAAAKGRERVLIVLEAGAKLPADLGGDIYASLEDRTALGPVVDVAERFLAGRL